MLSGLSSAISALVSPLQFFIMSRALFSIHNLLFTTFFEVFDFPAPWGCSKGSITIDLTVICQHKIFIYIETLCHNITLIVLIRVFCLKNREIPSSVSFMRT